MSDLDTARKLAARQAATTGRKPIDFDAEALAIARDMAPATPKPTRSTGHYGPAAGASGGPQVRPTRLRPPKFLRLSGPELDALWNRTGHELAGTVYLLLIGGSVFAGKYAGTGLVTYAQLQSLCRPPRPERGQWAPPPTLKRMRTTLAALEQAGLVERDAEGNQAQGQLRYRLPHRVGVGTP